MVHFRGISPGEVLMRVKFVRSAFMLLAFAMIAGNARADLFLFQWLDDEPALTGNTYQNGVLIQSVVVGDESYSDGYGLWNGATLLNDVNVNVNIYETDGVTLSDTWQLTGTAGAGFLNIPFNSDVDGSSLTPLPNAISLIETGAFKRSLSST